MSPAFTDQDRATIRFMADTWGWTPGRIAPVYDVRAVDIAVVLYEDTREGRSGTACEAPGTLEEPVRRGGAEVQPAAPHESQAKPEASAPRQDLSSVEHDRHSGSRPSRGGGTPGVYPTQCAIPGCSHTRLRQTLHGLCHAHDQERIQAKRAPA
jgi:hypothetical protein